MIRIMKNKVKGSSTVTLTIGITSIMVLSTSLLFSGIPSVNNNPLSDKSIDQRIQQHRTGEITLMLTNSSGGPVVNTIITIEMVKHKFLFGCNAYALDQCGTVELNQQYADRFAALFNYATLPFYWGSYESEQGNTSEARIRKMAEWCRNNNIHTKGHPLCWHEVQPKWLLAHPLELVETFQMRRIQRDVAAFAGIIATWDVVNEAVVMPEYKSGKNAISRLCQSLGQINLIRECFAEAERANSQARLLLNDYVTDERYEKLIADCIDADIKIDAIGIQSHMHTGYRGAQWAWETCERFAKFGKPLHFTELTILSGKLKTDSDWHSHHPGWESTPEGEERQTTKTIEIYRLLFSHPAVEAITWWDFSDLKAWQGAPAGLVRKDMTPKPVYDELMTLIKNKWWTGPLKLRTDRSGKVTFRGFLGNYTLTADQIRVNFELDKPDKNAKTIMLTHAIPEGS